MRETTSRLLQRLGRSAAALLPAPLSPPLRAAQSELRRSLHLAFRLATTHGRAVVLEPCRAATEGRLAVRLPEGVRWGRPSANVWFLHHGREALCLRLDLSGSVELLRYRPLFRAWTAC